MPLKIEIVLIVWVVFIQLVFAHSVRKIDFLGNGKLEGYSGYITVDQINGGNMFYWFFPTQNANKSVPLITCNRKIMLLFLVKLIDNFFKGFKLIKINFLLILIVINTTLITNRLSKTREVQVLRIKTKKNFILET